MYQIKQFLEVHPKKLKTQHHLATSRSQMSDVHGRQATIPNGKHYSHGEQNNIPGERIPLYQATNEQRHGHTNWMTMLMSKETSLDVWDMNSN